MAHRVIRRTEGRYKLWSLAFEPLIHYGAYSAIVIHHQDFVCNHWFCRSQRAPPPVTNRVSLGHDAFQNCAILTNRSILDNV